MREEGQKAAQTIGSNVIFHEISSKTHQNVHTSFPSLLNSFLLRKFKPPALFVKTSSSTFENNNNNNNNRGKGSGPNTPTSSGPSSPGYFYLLYFIFIKFNLILLYFICFAFLTRVSDR